MSSGPGLASSAVPQAENGALRGVTALVLAGGFGTRLRPAVGDTPKALAPVGGRPFLHYLLRYLSSHGVQDVVIGTGYGAEQIRTYCGDGAPWGLRVRYSHEAAPLGTGGAIKQAEGLVTSERLLVMNGDSLVRADLDEVLAFHEQRAALGTIVLVRVPERARFGSVALREDGAIAGFAEKAAEGTGWISAGVYLLERGVVADIPEGRQTSVEHEVFPRFVGRGLYGFTCPGEFLDIGTPDAYAAAQAFVPAWFGDPGNEQAEGAVRG